MASPSTQTNDLSADELEKFAALFVASWETPKTIEAKATSETVAKVDVPTSNDANKATDDVDVDAGEEAVAAEQDAVIELRAPEKPPTKRISTQIGLGAPTAEEAAQEMERWNAPEPAIRSLEIATPDSIDDSDDVEPAPLPVNKSSGMIVKVVLGLAVVLCCVAVAMKLLGGSAAKPAPAPAQTAAATTPPKAPPPAPIPTATTAAAPQVAETAAPAPTEAPAPPATAATAEPAAQAEAPTKPAVAAPAPKAEAAPAPKAEPAPAPKPAAPAAAPKPAAAPAKKTGGGIVRDAPF